MYAVIAKYKVHNSYKRAIFIKNGTPREVLAIHIGKTFNIEDAKAILKKVKNGRF